MARLLKNEWIIHKKLDRSFFKEYAAHGRYFKAESEMTPPNT